MWQGPRGVNLDIPAHTLTVRQHTFYSAGGAPKLKCLEALELTAEGTAGTGRFSTAARPASSLRTSATNAGEPPEPPAKLASTKHLSRARCFCDLLAPFKSSPAGHSGMLPGAVACNKSKLRIQTSSPGGRIKNCDRH